jgi:TolB protein
MVSTRRVALTAALAMLLVPSAAQAAFPGANGRIAFVGDRDTAGTGNTDIYTMNPDGSDVRRLTTDSNPDDNPAWSPDGTKIAFDGYRDGSNAVIIMNADGTDETSITGPGYFYPTGNPAWAPDGSRIVFQVVRAYEDAELYIAQADGNGLTRLTDNDTTDSEPAWSPDGTQVAFTRVMQPCTGAVCNFEIFVMNADGTNERRLTFHSDQDGDPNWSPDGRRIVWSRYGMVTTGTTETLVMNADGTDQRSFVPAAMGGEPAWSPDGRQIAWTGFGAPENGWDIDVMSADGSGQHSVSNSPAFEARPDWQPIPNELPDCSLVVPSRAVLTNANHRLVAMTLDGATDPDGDAVTITIDGITQDEPVEGRGDSTSPDALDDGGGQVRIRAERDSRGDGRVYRIAFTAADGRGGSCSGTATVSVPRKKHKPAVDSAPPSYDSFAR